MPNCEQFCLEAALQMLLTAVIYFVCNAIGTATRVRMLGRITNTLFIIRGLRAHGCSCGKHFRNPIYWTTVGETRQRRPCCGKNTTCPNEPLL